MENSKTTITCASLDFSATGFYVLKRRWKILTVFVLISILNELYQATTENLKDLWVSFMPQVDQSWEIYASFLLISIGKPFGIALIPFLTVHIGIRKSLWTVVLLDTVGISLQFLNMFIATAGTLLFLRKLLHLGGEVIVIAIAGSIGSEWFPSIQRTRVNAGCLMTKISSVAISRVLTVVPRTGIVSGVVAMAVFLLLNISCIVLLAVFYRPGDPTHDPSLAARIYSSERKETKYAWDSYKRCFQSKSFVVVLICFSLVAGVFQSWFTNIPLIISPLGHSKEVANILLFSMIGCGIVSSIFIAKWLEKTRQYTMATRAVFVCATIAVLLTYGAGKFSGDLTLLIIAHAMIGIACLPSVIIIIEAGMEETFPAHPDPITGLLFGGMFGVSMILGGFGTFWVDPETGRGDFVLILIGASAAICAAALKVFFNPTMNRTQIGMHFLHGRTIEDTHYEGGSGIVRWGRLVTIDAIAREFIEFTIQALRGKSHELRA